MILNVQYRTSVWTERIGTQHRTVRVQRLKNSETCAGGCFPDRPSHQICLGRSGARGDDSPCNGGSYASTIASLTPEAIWRLPLIVDSNIFYAVDHHVRGQVNSISALPGFPWTEAAETSNSAREWQGTSTRSWPHWEGRHGPKRSGPFARCWPRCSSTIRPSWSSRSLRWPTPFGTASPRRPRG